MSPSASDTDLAVQIFHVPDCPNVEDLRELVRQALVTLDLSATIEEIEGPYPSPTLLINGIDVIPRSDAVKAACRLDLPTEAEVLNTLLRRTRGRDGPRQAEALAPDTTDMQLRG